MICDHSTWWPRPIGGLKLWLIFRKRATNYRALWRKMTYKDQAYYDSTQSCSIQVQMGGVGCSLLLQTRWVLVIASNAPSDFVAVCGFFGDHGANRGGGVLQLEIVWYSPGTEKMRLEMVIGMEIRIQNGRHRCLFEGLIWKETWTWAVQDSVLNFYDHIESHLLGNGLSRYPVQSAIKWGGGFVLGIAHYNCGN